MTDFAALGVSARRAEALLRMGIAKPTPIQEKAIPPIIEGNDVIGQAQTGTGKTLAFVLPILEKLKPELPEVQALIVSPTRELALQITQEVKKLLPGRQGGEGIHVLTVYGGQDVEAQMHKLKGSVHLVVCTPGRLLDHLRRGTISLSSVKTLVLDEADQMLHMGFLKEVEEIVSQVPYKRQTLLFSATMPPNVRALAARFMRSPVEVTVQAPQITVKAIRQWAIETTDRAKQSALCKLIDEQRPYLAMIFCRTKRRASALNEALQEMGYNSDELHGDLSQAKREQVMKRFRNADLQLLVATDVAARGLDVEGVTHVFNYDIPQDVESYIHRIGRTGRAGGKGLAITFVAPKDRPELADIENGIRQTLERKRVDAGGSTASFEEFEERPKRAGGAGAAGRGGRAARTSQGQAKGRPSPGGGRSGRDSGRNGFGPRGGGAVRSKSEKSAKYGAGPRAGGSSAAPRTEARAAGPRTEARGAGPRSDGAGQRSNGAGPRSGSAGQRSSGPSARSNLGAGPRSGNGRGSGGGFGGGGNKSPSRPQRSNKPR